MSLTYERPSTRTLNGRSPVTPTSGFGAPVGPASTAGPIDPAGSYTAAELATRTGVPPAVLAMCTGIEQYAAIDVVRLAVLDRLMRSGVPVARAAALVQAAETLANTTI